MRTILQFRSAILLVALLVVWTFTFPHIGYAQEETDADLRATVRAVILSDPRTGEMSESDIEGMVSALTEGAETQGITSQDILWRPKEIVERYIGSCGETPFFLCALNQAFGFDGSDIAIPVGLGISSALLLFLIGSLLLHRHGYHPVAGSIGKPSSSRSPDVTYGP